MMITELSSLLPLFETIIAKINDGVLIFDKSETIYYLNSSAQKMLSLPEDETPTNLSQVTSVDLTQILQGFLSSQTQNPTQTSLPSIEKRITLKEGYRDLDFTYHTSHEVTESDPLYFMIIKDVTHSKKLNSYLKIASDELITNDPEMIALLKKIKRIASRDISILLQGESGTGKTHIAKLIHQISERSAYPLITLNCAAIPEALMESELFGQVEGAFYGAKSPRPGRFKYADKGTLLLDEVGEIPLHLQAKLLRAIQDQEFEAVGSDKTIKVDVRIIASSNQNLLEMVNQGKFRPDLYYRLAVIPVHIPPLRERPGDIPLLITHFCKELVSRGYTHKDIECGAETMRLMMNYDWPGNVRELENAVEHAIICSQSHIVEPESLPLEIVNQYKTLQKERIDQFQKGHENILRNEIIMALERAQGNKTKAARELGVDRSTLWRRMRKLEITG